MATINYWEDDWEQQIEKTQLESWEDLVDEPASTPPQDIELKKDEKEIVVESAWSKPKVIHYHTQDYTKDFPTIKNDDDKNHQTEKERVRRLKERTKDNIFEAFNEDTCVAKKPTRTKFTPPKPLPKDKRNENESKYRRPPMKSRFCKDGVNCTRGDRCWWAHSERELVPERCNRGQDCRCIIVDHNKEVFNNSRSRRVCMYRHDESITSYLKRTGQAPVIQVPKRLSTQATEMAKVSGSKVVVEVL